MRRLLFAVAALLTARTAFALNPSLDVNQYAHTAWRVRDGFTKGAILSMAQAPDGYLYLATEFGLLRFDGVRTVPWNLPAGQHLPSEYVTRLLRAPDDTLWIGTRAGLVAWKNGRLIEYPQLAGRTIVRLFEDRKGILWVATGLASGRDEDLCALRNGAVTCEATGRGIGSVHALYEDRRGNLWVGTTSGLWRWNGAPYFVAIPEAPVYGLAEGDDGALVLGTAHGVRRFVNGRVEAYPLSGMQREIEVHELFRDRDGGLWTATGTAGLLHVHGGVADAITVSSGLSGETPTAFLEDREHNIWVATTSGLDRFRERAVTRLSVPQGVPDTGVMSVLAAPDGDIWVGTTNGMRQSTGSRVTTPEIVAGQRDGKVNGQSPASLFQDSRGRIWIVTPSSAGYLENHQFVTVDKLSARNPVHAIAEDDRGSIWMADQERGLFRVPPQGSAEQIRWDTFGDRGDAYALAADVRRGGLWLGFRDGTIVYFSDGRVAESYQTDGPANRRPVRQLRFDQEGTLWASTEAGVGRVKNGRMATLSSRNGLPCDVVLWTIEDDAHALWVSMSCALVRIARADLDGWAASIDDNRNPPRTIQPLVLDASDGVSANLNSGAYAPKVAKGAGGRLWFASDGLRVFDPAHLPLNAVPPPVHIEQVIADRTIYEPALSANGRMRLPLLRDLEIEFTALSFAAPEKVRFRYMLEGFDHEWQDAGNRRKAIYTNLPARRYRFRAVAANNNGVWNEAGAVLDFVIAPAFYQTTWFAALSFVAVIGAVWGAHRLRLRGVEKHQQEISALNERLMKAQEQERIRIAGELHDGVMQRMLAATMMLGTAKRRIGDNPDVAATIDKVQDTLIQAGTEIRQLSHDLHPPALQEAGLPQAVRAYCEQFSAACGIPVSCEADDSVHELSRGAALALFRIMQEALGNAAKHAAPSSIAVRLTRSNGIVSLVVADDGAGFDGSRLGTSGGLGLIMMRERASQLNGKFEFESAPGRGTTIRVSIPFR